RRHTRGLGSPDAYHPRPRGVRTMTRASTGRQSGFTLIELLISMAVVGIILISLTTIFVSQTRISERTQDRNEVDSKLRSIAEVVMQDLQQAGSVATFDGVTQPIYRNAELGTGCSRSERSGCVVVGANSIDLSVYYMTSLVRPSGGTWARGAAACRRIDYQIQDDELFRRDVACGDTSTAFSDYSFATGVDDLSLSFICHDP